MLKASLSVKMCKSQYKYCTKFPLSFQPRSPVRCEFLMRYPSDILVITLQLKLHNCFIGTAIIFPFACWSSPLLMGSGVGDSAIALDVLFSPFFTTFMSLTFGVLIFLLT